MNKLIKSILITPDMVSLWLPSGQNRAMDIIRGNHGQCYGTHPNVPVLPNVINPSLGWEFDGTDDDIDLGTPASLNVGSNSFTIIGWLKFTSAAERVIFGKYTSHYFRVNVGNLSFRWGVSSVDADTAINDDVWHLGAIVMDKVADTATFYVDAEEDGVRDISTWGAIGNSLTRIGSREGSLFFEGYVALLALANEAWSAAQVNNFYLATKGLFSPRG